MALVGLALGAAVVLQDDGSNARGSEAILMLMGLVLVAALAGRRRCHGLVHAPALPSLQGVFEFETPPGSAP